MKIYLFVLLFLLALMPLAIAPSPFINANSNLGYQIRAPIYESIKQGASFDFNFHVYNISDGLPVTNGSVQCVFHLYNQSGDHVYALYPVPHDPVTDHGVTNEWVARINGPNFTSVGYYNYVLQCNGSTYGGFNAEQIFVTPTGFEITTAQTIIMVIIIAALLILTYFLFSFGMNSMNLPVKIFCLALSSLLLVFTIGYISTITNTTISEYTSIVQGINPIYILLISLVTVGGAGLVIWLIASSLTLFSKTRYGTGDE